MTEQDVETLLDLNEKLLHAIVAGDWKTYSDLCDPTLSAFEPEALGHLVEGMDFHKFYFGLPADKSPRQVTMSSPHVRLMGDAAVVSCVRINQIVAADGQPVSKAVEETRVWQKIDGKWKHVHFHRSPV